jgi:Raf kinase inhibitor-like YbhB/YbcL family protein
MLITQKNEQIVVTSCLTSIRHVLKRNIPVHKTGYTGILLLIICVFLGPVVKNSIAAQMNLECNAFSNGDTIPVRYTCNGTNISPPMKWRNLPKGTRSLALICYDPDAPSGTWTHWVYYNIPPKKNRLAEHIQKMEYLPDGSIQGKNDFGKTGYDGPCPPYGIHRYYFKLFAIDTVLNLPGNISRETLLRTIRGHIIGEAELMARYGKTLNP